MTALKMALTDLSPGRCLSVAASAVIIILGSSSQAWGYPLVYPNRFSFQKTSTTTTDVPLHDHDYTNNSISSFGNAMSTESGLPSSRGFRYDLAAWVIGAIFLAGLLCFICYPKTRRRNDGISSASSSCYVFPANSTPNLVKSDLDSSSIVRNTSSENT